jgi:hypothetical protein
MQQEGISKISSQFRAHLCSGPLFKFSNTWQLFSCLVSPILASLVWLLPSTQASRCFQRCIPPQTGQTIENWIPANEMNFTFSVVSPVGTTLLVLRQRMRIADIWIRAPAVFAPKGDVTYSRLIYPSVMQTPRGQALPD